MKSSLLIFIIAYSSIATSQIIEVINQQSEIKVSTSGFAFERKAFKKEIDSGLTTKIDVVLEVIDNKRRMIISKLVYEIKFDLWDEVFYFRENNEKIRKVKDHQQFLKTLSKISFNISKNDFKKMKILEPFNFAISYIVNPIEKEKTKKIKKWIAERNVSRANISSNSGVNTYGILNGIVNQVVIEELNKNYYGAAEAIILKSKDYDLQEFLK